MELQREFGPSNIITSKIVNSILEFILIICSVILVSNTSKIVFNDTYLSIFFIILLIIFTKQKKKLDRIVIYISGLWIVINVFSFTFNGTIFPINSIFGYLIRLFIPYLILKIIGISFWGKFEKLVYIFTLLSIPIFLLNALFPDLFIELDSIFGSWASEVYKLKDSQQYYWYSIIYTFSGRISSEEMRNSGFMWEPGAFAMVIIFAILYNLFKNNYKLNSKIYIYSLALITTFSTMGYIGLFLLTIFFLINRKGIFLKILIIALSIVFIPAVLELQFLVPKIKSYFIEYALEQHFIQAHTGRYEVNRLLSFIYDLEKVLAFPIGYGVIPDKFSFNPNGDSVVGVNGLGKIIYNWGFFGFVFLIITIRKFSLIVFTDKISRLNVAFVILIVLISFFSNPIEKNFFLFSIILTPYIQEFRSIQK